MQNLLKPYDKPFWEKSNLGKKKKGRSRERKNDVNRGHVVP